MTIQVPFIHLNLVIEVYLSILNDDMPSLLSNRDLLENCLDISLQDGYLHMGDRKQPLTLDNYFFIHKWRAKYISYVLYTEHELRSIHRAFGHPSVSSLH